MEIRTLARTAGTFCKCSFSWAFSSTWESEGVCSGLRLTPSLATHTVPFLLCFCKIKVSSLLPLFYSMDMVPLILCVKFFFSNQWFWPLISEHFQNSVICLQKYKSSQENESKLRFSHFRLKIQFPICKLKGRVLKMLNQADNFATLRWCQGTSPNFGT